MEPKEVMIEAVDIAMGILLGLSASLLALALVSYRRSGVTALLLVSVGLSIHLSLTVMIFLVGHFTDELSDVDGAQLVLLDLVVLLAALLVGVLGGKPRA